MSHLTVNADEIAPVLLAKINGLPPQELFELVKKHRTDVVDLLVRLTVSKMIKDGFIAPAQEVSSFVKPVALPAKPAATKMVYMPKTAPAAAQPAAPSFAAIAKAVDYIPPPARKQAAKETKVIMPPWMMMTGTSYKTNEGVDLHLVSVHNAYMYDCGDITDIRFMLIMAVGHILIVGITGNTGHGSYFRVATYKGKAYAVPAGWNEVSCNKGRYHVFTKTGDALAGYGFALDTKPGTSPFMWFVVKEDGKKFVPVSPKDPAFMAKIGCFLPKGDYAQTRHSQKQQEPPVPETAHIVSGGVLTIDEQKPVKEQKNANGASPNGAAVADQNAFAVLDDESDVPNGADEAAAAGLAPCLDSDEEDNEPASALANGQSWANA